MSAKAAPRSSPEHLPNLGSEGSLSPHAQSTTPRRAPACVRPRRPPPRVSANDIPLFPLNTVLFPGGPLSLRIFEQRYLDMIRDCARTGSGFGVCMILHGREAGEAAVPAAVGTLARIVEFYTMPDG